MGVGFWGHMSGAPFFAGTGFVVLFQSRYYIVTHQIKNLGLVPVPRHLLLYDSARESPFLKYTAVDSSLCVV